MYILCENGGAICYSGSTTAGPVETVTADAKCCPKAWCDARRCIKRTRFTFPSIGSIFRSSAAEHWAGEKMECIVTMWKSVEFINICQCCVCNGESNQPVTHCCNCSKYQWKKRTSLQDLRSHRYILKVLGGVMSCRLVNGYQQFEGWRCSQFQGRTSWPWRLQSSNVSPLFTAHRVYVYSPWSLLSTILFEI